MGSPKSKYKLVFTRAPEGNVLGILMASGFLFCKLAPGHGPQDFSTKVQAEVVANVKKENSQVLAEDMAGRRQESS